jgi:ubiquinone/menaquinone biosynthesis C-methylase UbiE
MVVISNDDQKRRFTALFDDVAPVYDALDVDFFTPFGRHLVELAAPQRGAHVLDVGCGRGAVLRPLARAVGPEGQVVGIDLAPAMVALTTADLRSENLSNVEVRVGDAENPPIRDGGWDLLTAGFVVFFLPSGAGVLEHWHGVLRPGGRLAFSTFVGRDERWVPVFDVFGPYLPDGMTPSQGPPPGWWSDESSIAGVVTTAGFTDVRSTTETFTSRFRDPDHWFAFSRSVGTRAYWDVIGEADAQHAEAAMRAVMEPMRESDGSLVVHTQVRVTTATA